MVWALTLGSVVCHWFWNQKDLSIPSHGTQALQNTRCPNDLRQPADSLIYKVVFLALNPITANSAHGTRSNPQAPSRKHEELLARHPPQNGAKSHAELTVQVRSSFLSPGVLIDNPPKKDGSNAFHPPARPW